MVWFVVVICFLKLCQTAGIHCLRLALASYCNEYCINDDFALNNSLPIAYCAAPTATMALPQHKTCLSILRSILGPGAGNEACFAKKIGRSISWLTKASCGQIPLSEDAAVRIGYETGINVRWLLVGDITKPPVDRDRKPYTLETYVAHWEVTRDGYDASDAAISDEDIGIIFHKLLQSYLAARIKNRGAYFAFKLENTTDEIVTEFGADDIKKNPVALGIVENLQGMISWNQMDVWNMGRSLASMEKMGGRIKYADSLPPDETSPQTEKPTPQKKQPSRKSKRPA